MGSKKLDTSRSDEESDDRIEAEEISALRADGTIDAMSMFERIAAQRADGSPRLEDETMAKAKELTSLRDEIRNFRSKVSQSDKEAN